MFAINNLTASGNQTSIALLADGTSVTLTFRYRPAIQRWTVDVTRGTFVAKGLGLSTNPNRLRTWRNVIPFGLRVETADGTDPFMADDLASAQGTPARVTVSVLDGSSGRTDLIDSEAASLA